MNRAVKLRFLVFTLALFALTCGFATPVLGVKPDVVTFSFEDEIEYDCPDGCTLIFNLKQQNRVTTFFDNDGIPIRAQIKVSGREMFTHSETGNSITANFALTRIIDFEEGTLAVVGLSWQWIIPGEGPNTTFFVVTGKVVFDMTTWEVIFKSASIELWPPAEPYVPYFCSMLGQA